MIDLSGIARRLRLSVDQIRLAADLIEQGYHPGFISRYRSDESGCLSRETLWAIKLGVDRQKRLEVAREKAKQHLPKDAVLDEEGEKFLASASTEVEIEASTRSYRARRNLAQSQERSGVAGQLLEALIAYEGEPIGDLPAWVASTLTLDAEAATTALEQTKKLIQSLLHGDTGLNEKLRRTIQKKATLSVSFLETETSVEKESSAEAEVKEGKDKADTEDATGQPADSSTASDSVASDSASSDSTSTDASATPATSETAGSVEESGSGETTGSAVSTEQTAALAQEATESAETDASASEASADANAGDNESTPAADSDAQSETQPAAQEENNSEPQAAPAEAQAESADATATTGGAEANAVPKADSKAGKEKRSQKKPAGKPASKLTPRQRRRRWLIAMLQPMKSLKRQITKLTAYQQLMLGRGRRSQLVDTPLEYDRTFLRTSSRDVFVASKHPLADWFGSTIDEILAAGWQSRLEADALADLEEIAQDRLLETAVDQLRQNLMRRPVRGHTIMVVDTVGPKTVSVAVVDPNGKVLATDEVPCSAQPDVINQNVVRLGELAHRFRVSLVALTNGPARRFMILSIRELMKQSAESGLRWTMADRSGAEAYAAGRTGLRELSVYNRRDRAAIWVGRCLQNPLAELLKTDINRLRLGSYQRELPQEPLKQLVRDTIADCVCAKGIDAHKASVEELVCVPGVEEPQAQQISQLGQGVAIGSRANLLSSISDWPEKAARQAISTLRVFGSEEPLDSTAIHPDDYRLATRLIENTELEAPPAAPEGWLPPEPAVEEVPATEEVPAAEGAPNSQAVQDESVESAGDVTAEESASDSAEAESAAPVTSEAVTSEAVTSEAVAAESTGSDAEQIDSSASESEGTSEAEESAQDDAANAEAANSETAPAAESEVQPEATAGDEAATAEENTAEENTAEENTAEENTAPAVQMPKPEYPEDIIAEESKSVKIEVEKLARGWQVGREKLRWVTTCLQDPFADPRLSGTPVPMMDTMPTLSTLQPGTCLWAVVVGVAEFGAFVELAPDCSGLIHISRLSDHYVEDPHQVVQVGDLILAWVVSVDEKKNRVALTALSPEQRAAANAEAEQRRSERRGGGGNRRGSPRSGGGSQSGDRGGQRGDNRGKRPGGGRDGRGGGRDGGRGGRRDQGGGRGRSHGGNKSSKPIIVTSKKPKAEISDAMREGDEPLRSFSDLMQFYEAKRTDVPDPKSGKDESAKVVASTESQAAEQQSSDKVAPQEAASSNAPDVAVAEPTVNEAVGIESGTTDSQPADTSAGSQPGGGSSSESVGDTGAESSTDSSADSSAEADAK